MPTNYRLEFSFNLDCPPFGNSGIHEGLGLKKTLKKYRNPGWCNDTGILGRGDDQLSTVLILQIPVAAQETVGRSFLTPLENGRCVACFLGVYGEWTMVK